MLAVADEVVVVDDRVEEVPDEDVVEGGLDVGLDAVDPPELRALLVVDDAVAELPPVEAELDAAPVKLYNCSAFPAPQYSPTSPVQGNPHCACGIGFASTSKTSPNQHSLPYSTPKYLYGCLTACAAQSSMLILLFAYKFASARPLGFSE